MKGAELDPDAMEDLGRGMSNYDHKIEAGVEEALKSRPGEVHCSYAGWDFHGCVWFAEGQFHCRVKVYCEIQEVVSAASLQGIMDAVSAKYGDG